MIGTLNREIMRVIKMPDTCERLVSYGLDVVTSTPEEYTAFRKADVAKWTKIIKDINLRYE